MNKNYLQSIIKEAKTKKGYITLIENKYGMALGDLRINIQKFKKIGFIIEVDIPFDIDKKVIKKIRTKLEFMLKDVSVPEFKEKLNVDKSSITCAFYDRDEENTLGFIINELGVMAVK